VDVDELQFAGRWNIECVNPDGSVAWEERIPNMTLLAALTDVLSVYLGAGAQKTAWYLGLIDNSGFASLSNNDTAASHAGWTENTAYSGGARPAWTPGAAAGQGITNPTPTIFPATGTATIRGAFLISDATLGGTAGLMFASGLFAANKSVVNGQSIKAIYTCAGTGS
jgi:hypothetical protein